MSEILDVMGLLPAHCPYFTVDTTPGVLAVDILRPTGTPTFDYFLRSAGGLDTFRAGDNFVVVSAGFVLPESFILAQGVPNVLQNNPSFVIGAQPVGSSSIYFLPNFSVDGIIMPIENYELPLNVFVDISDLDIGAGVYPFRTTAFNLPAFFRGLNESNSDFPQVSMVGVPAVLNGTVQHLTLFAKIVHNFPLTAVIP